MSNSKRFLSFCLCLLLLASFPASFLNVKVSAAENLIDPDLRNWENAFPDSSRVYAQRGGYVFQVKKFDDNSPLLRLGLLYHGSELVSGNRYKLTIHLMSGSEVGYSDALINNSYPHGSLTVAVTSQFSESSQITDIAYFTVDNSNYLDVLGNDIVLTFTMPDIVNPTISISYSNSSTSSDIYLAFSNISLIDLDQEKEDGFLAKIKEFFDNLRDSITEALENLLEGIKQGLRDLFVPTSEDLQNFKDNMSNLFADKLGFIYSAGSFLGDVFDSLHDLFTGNSLDGSLILTLPGLSFDFLGFHIHLWDDTAINIGTLISGTSGISILYNIYKVMLHFFFISTLVAYAEKIYKGVLHSA